IPSFCLNPQVHPELESSVSILGTFRFCSAGGEAPTSCTGSLHCRLYDGETLVPCADGFSRVRGGRIKSVPDLSNSCLFPHTHLCLHSHWIPSRRLRQSPLDAEFTGTSSSCSVRQSITYLSLDPGDFNFSSRKHHSHSKQYLVPLAVRFRTRGTGHEDPLGDNFFPYRCCGEPYLCRGRSRRIFSHWLP